MLHACLHARKALVVDVNHRRVRARRPFVQCHHTLDEGQVAAHHVARRAAEGDNVQLRPRFEAVAGDGDDGLAGNALRWKHARHHGRQSGSVLEEADALAATAATLLLRRAARRSNLVHV